MHSTSGREPSVCRQCGAPLKAPTRGRRTQYCSLSCRRAVEIRRRVWDVALARLERECVDYSALSSPEVRAAGRQRRDAFLLECPRP
jgi:hypothetical protein